MHTSVCLYSSDAALAHREAVSWEIHRAVVLPDKASDNYCVKICRMASRTFCSPGGWEGGWQNPKLGGDLEQTSGRTVVALCGGLPKKHRASLSEKRDWMSLTRSLPSRVCGALRLSLEQHELWVPGPREGSVFSSCLGGHPDLGRGTGALGLQLYLCFLMQTELLELTL